MLIERTVTCEEEGRQITFGIRLMSALQLESWLMRVADMLPPETVQPVIFSPTEFAALVVQRGLFPLACCDCEKAEPLLEELLRCCCVVSSETGAEIPCSSQNINDHINDVRNLLRLRTTALLANLGFAFKGARKPLELPREAAFRRAAAEKTYARSVNLPHVTAALISQGMASLQDLRQSYTYSEALDLLEVLNVRNYNNWAGHEAMQRRR